MASVNTPSRDTIPYIFLVDYPHFNKVVYRTILFVKISNLPTGVAGGKSGFKRCRDDTPVNHNIDLKQTEIYL
jgi:hypothetical protein